jgi:TPR repeat protein
MNGLGYLHAQPGPGREKNMTAAVHYFNQAAEAGHSDGHYNMGILALTGNGVTQARLTMCESLHGKY